MMMSSILNLDENQIYYDSGYSDTPSPSSSSTSSRIMESPMSQTSDSGRYNALNLYTFDEAVGQDVYQQNRTYFTSVPRREQPKLVLLEEPVEKFRFRYKSEMHGTHGSLMGANNGKQRKTFPTVELRGYHGRAVIRCALYQTSTLEPSPHSHKLVVRHNDVDISDPHDLYLSPEDGYRAVFQGMGIIHTAKKYIFDELLSKKIREKKFELGRSLTTLEESQIKLRAEKETKYMNLNQVKLGFTAYAVNHDDSWTWLCGPIFSRPINNMKSALTGELKISRLSAAVSSAAGGDELIILVEKVGKKNIRVKFYEVDENDDEVWASWGVFSEADVHHQYAIALRTPAYKNKDIDRHVDVFIQLYRPSDQDKSEPVPFRYKPRDSMKSRKRARTSSSGLSSFDIPETIITELQAQIKDTPQKSLSLGSMNKSEILDKLLYENLPAGFEEQVMMDSDELMRHVEKEYFDHFDDDSSKLETDGAASTSASRRMTSEINTRLQKANNNSNCSYLPYFKKISGIASSMYNRQSLDKSREQILQIFKAAKANDQDILHNVIVHQHINTMSNVLKWIDKLELYEVLQFQNEKRETCLHIACFYDGWEYIKPLINLGINPNIQDDKGNTALHVAIEENTLKCASRILDKKNYTKKSIALQVDLANDDGFTPLHLAVKKRNLAMVKKLLEDGQASTKICISKNGNNALHIAVEQNDKEIVKYLLESTKVNINEQNTSGYSPLRLAYSMGKEAKKVIQLLLEHGAKAINQQDFEDDLPMAELETLKTSNSDESSEDEDYDEKPLYIEEYNFETVDPNAVIMSKEEAAKTFEETFNKNGKWQELARILKLTPLLKLYACTGNPSLALLNYIKSNYTSKAKLEEVANAIARLGDEEALNSFWNAVR